MLVEEFRLDFQGMEGGGGAFVEDEVVAAVWHDFVCVGDAERFEAQKLNFDRQAKDAWWWRDACLLYFQKFSGMKLPLDCPAPKYKFEDLEKYNLPIDNYTRAPFDKLP